MEEHTGAELGTTPQSGGLARLREPKHFQDPGHGWGSEATARLKLKQRTLLNLEPDARTPMRQRRGASGRLQILLGTSADRVPRESHEMPGA